MFICQTLQCPAAKETQTKIYPYINLADEGGFVQFLLRHLMLLPGKASFADMCHSFFVSTGCYGQMTIFLADYVTLRTLTRSSTNISSSSESVPKLKNCTLKHTMEVRYLCL
ncbi:hypothetical protein AVEN_154581-1 [Araneus ventricosus]|uniref:Uncharacterized protein n=1 Tax=Araneus ventricosus TaxID=182803 RepID=A0A4Y2FSB6_ARAVE|nr:hypothetical protein AVEN_154581-1 [Araneus ventricosus]